MGTRATGEAHSDFDGWIAPAFGVRAISCAFISLVVRPALYGGSRNGFAPGTRSMLCFVLQIVPSEPSHIFEWRFSI